MFDLRTLIQSVIAEREEWTLSDLVEAVMKRVPEKSLAEALEVSLWEYARIRLKDSPPRQASADSQMNTASSGLMYSSVATLPTETSMSTVSRASLFRKYGFRNQVHVGASSWKSLLECTKIDLEFAASELDVMAERHSMAAKRYRLVVDEMDRQGAETAGELSEEVLQALFEEIE